MMMVLKGAARGKVRDQIKRASAVGTEYVNFFFLSFLFRWRGKFLHINKLSTEYFPLPCGREHIVEATSDFISLCLSSFTKARRE